MVLRLKEKRAAATSLCNSLRTTIPLEHASEIDGQRNHVRGCDNARRLRMVGDCHKSGSLVEPMT